MSDAATSEPQNADVQPLTDDDILQRFLRTKNQPTGSQTLGYKMLSVSQEKKEVEVQFEAKAELLSNPMRQVQGGYLYVVFDNSSKIGKIDASITSGTLSAGSTSKSEYEGITYDDVGALHFYVVKEMEKSKGKVFTYDASLNLEAQEWTDVTFQINNKGFEGVAYARKGTADYLLGLCEGNNCLDANEPVGNGKLKVLRPSSGSWVTETTLNIPSSATFDDYSDIALHSNDNGTYKVAVTSQQSSRIWIGTLTTSPWGFSGTSQVFEFPKADGDAKQYCNVEGVTFLTSTQVAIVSDQYTGSKSSPCFNKDEMVHIFNIP